MECWQLDYDNEDDFLEARAILLAWSEEIEYLHERR
jgi:hypothetical protein